MAAGNVKLTAHCPRWLIADGTRATSTPSTRAVAVTFAPVGIPPSARVTSSVADTLSPGP